MGEQEAQGPSGRELRKGGDAFLKHDRAAAADHGLKPAEPLEKARARSKAGGQGGGTEEQRDMGSGLQGVL